MPVLRILLFAFIRLVVDATFISFAPNRCLGDFNLIRKIQQVNKRQCGVQCWLEAAAGCASFTFYMPNSSCHLHGYLTPQDLAFLGVLDAEHGICWLYVLQHTNAAFSALSYAPTTSSIRTPLSTSTSALSTAAETTTSALQTPTNNFTFSNYAVLASEDSTNGTFMAAYEMRPFVAVNWSFAMGICNNLNYQLAIGSTSDLLNAMERVLMATNLTKIDFFLGIEFKNSKFVWYNTTIEPFNQTGVVATWTPIYGNFCVHGTNFDGVFKLNPFLCTELGYFMCSSN